MATAQIVELAPYAVVVGVDFSPASRVAVREALRLTLGMPNAELHLVHVLSEHEGGATRSARLRGQERLLGELPKDLRKIALDEAHALGARAARSAIGVHVRIGAPAAAILQLSVDVAASLIIVGTRGLGRVAELVLGSLAQELVRVAHCPLLIAREIDYDGLRASDQVEPSCAACITTRSKTGGAEWWCTSHARPHVPSHVYSSTEVVHWATHDSEVSATGVDT